MRNRKIYCAQDNVESQEVTERVASTRCKRASSKAAAIAAVTAAAADGRWWSVYYKARANQRVNRRERWKKALNAF